MIRIGELKDALDIYNVEILCFLNHYSIETIKSDLKNKNITFFLYEKNNKVVGYISIYHFLDEANLQKIAILENERRNGYARELIEYACNYLKEKDVSKIYLEVNEKNLIAIKVYEKLGFNKISTRKNYYGNDSAIIYERKI